MKHKQIEEGRICDHGGGLGTATWEMVRRRAREIAQINGRNEHQILDSDFEQAHRELLGQERLSPVPTTGETLSERQRWDPVPGSAGHRAPTLLPPDEQEMVENLVEEGMAEAEFDRQLAASRDADSQYS